MNIGKCWILKSAPLTLDARELTLPSATPIQVMGSESNVCLVLNTNRDDDAKDQDKVFAQAMQGAKVDASLTTKDGKSYVLSSLGKSWSMYGKLTDGQEHAACYSTCGTPIPTGSVVSQITLKALPALKVQGIYWESTNAFDLIQDANKKTKPAS